MLAVYAVPGYIGAQVANRPSYQTGPATSAQTVFGPCVKPPQNFVDFICISVEIVDLAIPYVATSALLAFIWGLSMFIMGSGSEEKVADGKMIMKWGIIGLFVMFSIWAIMEILARGFGFDFGLPLLPE